MTKVSIVFKPENELTEEELLALLPQNICDSILCVRDNDENSILLKGDVRIYLKRNNEELFYNN